MVTWREFAELSPELARLGKERIEKHGLCLLGTIRKDGTPRISPLEPDFFEGELCIGGMWRSMKNLDLVRDPRCLIHSVVANKDGTDGEFKLRGRAIDVVDVPTRGRFADKAFAERGWRPPEPYHLFTVDIESVAFIQFKASGMHLRRWPGPDGWTVRKR
jgi:hypothetical protein